MKVARIFVGLIVMLGVLFGLNVPISSAVEGNNAQLMNGYIDDTRLMNGYSGQCLTQYGYRSNGTPTRMEGCGGAPAVQPQQRWTWLSGSGTGANYKRLINQYTEGCLNGSTYHIYQNYPCSLAGQIDIVTIYGYYGAFLIRSVYNSSLCLAGGGGYAYAFYPCLPGESRHRWYRV